MTAAGRPPHRPSAPLPGQVPVSGDLRRCPPAGRPENAYARLDKWRQDSARCEAQGELVRWRFREPPLCDLSLKVVVDARAELAPLALQFVERPLPSLQERRCVRLGRQTITQLDGAREDAVHGPAVS